ncbi:Lsr2 dimerization domain-containing protein [Streptomyces scabiei]|uniref:Lsr2 family DNA-binding protein n=1 Tax=Streptomyces scabiei TaxID=1930 RepID=UPI0029B160FF|nr:histone-like nucleoid-structuring protein Lsr2 [Streptomyces scabiei]MDX3523699.1 Lsr2 family protein [Streptomyces scabiei]
MTTDWQQALAAESRPPRPSPLEELAAAARVTARNAGDKHDLAELLDAIGAPSDADTLTALLPHLPDTASGDLMTTQAPNAYSQAAADMLNRGDNPDQVRETLGLSDAELAEAVQQAEAELAQQLGTIPDADGAATGGTDPELEAPGTVTATPEAGIEALLVWGEQHATKGVQALAAKARTALAELVVRRDTEQAVAEAEGRVDRLERELARARAELREVRTGKCTPTSVVAPVLSGKFNKDQLAAIRTWARANGYEVADRGNPARKVLDAYFAANPTTAEAVR